MNTNNNTKEPKADSISNPDIIPKKELAAMCEWLINDPSPEKIRVCSRDVEIRLAGYYSKDLSLTIELVRLGPPRADSPEAKVVKKQIDDLNRSRAMDVIVAPALAVDEDFINAERAIRKAAADLENQENEHAKLNARVEIARKKTPKYYVNLSTIAQRERQVISEFWDLSCGRSAGGGTPRELKEGLDYLKKMKASGGYNGEVSMEGSKLRDDALHQVILDAGGAIKTALSPDDVAILASDESKLLEMLDKIASLKAALARCQQRIQKMTTDKVDALKVALARLNALIDCRDQAAAHGGELAI